MIECPSNIIAKLHRNQIDDEELTAIRNKIDKRQTKKYFIQDGLLCKRKNGEINSDIKIDARLYILLQQIHEPGHLDPEETKKITKNGLLV